MNIVRWEPFRDLVETQERMNRLFSDVYGRSGRDEVMARSDWAPPVDVYQNDAKELVIVAELPGMKREDIELTVDNNTMTLRGERKQASDVKEESYHRVERTYGTFSRSFSLPQTVDAGKVRAEYREGVLSVVLPMREEAKPKQITVKAAS